MGRMSETGVEGKVEVGGLRSDIYVIYGHNELAEVSRRC